MEIILKINKPPISSYISTTNIISKHNSFRFYTHHTSINAWNKVIDASLDTVNNLLEIDYLDWTSKTLNVNNIITDIKWITEIDYTWVVNSWL